MLTLRRERGAIYARGLVRSEEEPGRWYVVRVLIDRAVLGGEWAIRIAGTCTCPAFHYGRACKHITWLANKALARVRAVQRAN